MNKINIVIPMAGMGSRFAKEGYAKPKPFINVMGKPMIERVLENLSLEDANYYLIARKEHLDREPEIVRNIEDNYAVEFIAIDKLTEGTAATVLFARKFINNDDPLLIANSDQIVDFVLKEFVDDCFSRNLDGSILTFTDHHKDSKWSFARTNGDGIVVEVQEKVPISDKATVGIYLFSKGRFFVDAAVDMIIENDRVNNEFYTCPVYNYLIRENKRIGLFDIHYSEMHGIGTPSDLDNYISHFS